MPFFSVIIPVYNVQKYLPECMDSVLTQDFRDFEAVLVDDGSTDQSGALCDVYAEKDTRVHVIHQQNQGLGQARNAGLRVASGEWILFLDSDDTWCEGCLQGMYREMQLHPGCELYVGKWIKHYVDTGTEDATPVGSFEPGPKHFSTLQEKIQYYGDNCGWGPTKMVIKREIISDPLLLFLPDVRNGEDLYWVTMLLQRVERFCFVDIITFRYRIQNSGTLSELSSVNALKWLDSMALTVAALDRVVGQEQPFVHAWLMNKYASFFVLAAQKKQKEQWLKRLPDFVKNLRTADAQNLYRTARILKRVDEASPGNLWLISRILCSLQGIKKARRKKKNAAK